eukprot:m51a1_g3125 putative 3 -cyclic-nucleotide phosphodiesterase rega (1136) ;mRNA; f:230010-237954
MKIRAQRLRVCVLQAVLIAFVVSAVVTAVIVPWSMARTAGLDSVREVAIPLVRRVVATARSEVLSILQLAPETTEHVLDSMLRTGQLRPGNTTHDIHEFIAIGLLHSPDMQLRYMCMIYKDCQMGCAQFDKASNTTALNVMQAISAGLYRLDLRNHNLDRDQERWIRQEFFNGSETASAIALSTCNSAAILDTVDKELDTIAVEMVDQAGVDFSSWEFSVLGNESSYVRVCSYALKQFGAPSLLRVTDGAIVSFLQRAEALYNDAPYHNKLHAADVVHAACYLITQTPEMHLSPMEKLSVVLAAALHDIGHPGRTNQFQCATLSDLALVYNDQSVLENHHASTGYRLMLDSGILDSLKEGPLRDLRRNVVGLILATDMGRHFELVSEFKSRMASGASHAEAKSLSMKMVIKLADSSNLCRPRAEMLEWVNRVYEEFLQQGDDEKARGLPVSANMDRDDSSVARLEQNYLKFICCPMFQVIVPWSMARTAGLDSVREVAIPLIRRVVATARSEVLHILQLAPETTEHVLDSMLRTGQLRPGNTTHDIHEFIAIGLLHSPDMQLRYMCMGYTDCRMGCAQFNKASNTTALNAKTVHSIVPVITKNEEAPFFFAEDTYFTSSARISGAEETIHVAALPTQDKYGLNWTTIVAVAESDYTGTLTHQSRSALIAGIAIVCGAPLAIGAVSIVALVVIMSATRKVFQAETSGVTTGIDKVMSLLLQIKNEDLTHDEVEQNVTQVMQAISAGLYKLDLRNHDLDRDQMRWIRQEFFNGSETASAIALSTCSSAAVLTSRVDRELEAIAEDLADEAGRNFSTWDFSVLGDDSCYVRVCSYALKQFGAPSLLRVTDGAIVSFLQRAEALYNDAPYHNKLHAADVVHAACYLITQTPEMHLSPMEKLSVVLAAALHDIGHPGRTNQFQCATLSDLALVYNDQSVLENHHASTGYRLMLDSGILDSLKEGPLRDLRRNVVGLILATDMGRHFELVSEFKSRMASGASHAEAKSLSMKMVIKLADSSNLCRPRAEMLEWVNRVYEEFLQQGDDEKARGLPVSANMDRDDSSVARLEQNYLKFICCPMFQAAAVGGLMRALQRKPLRRLLVSEPLTTYDAMPPGLTESTGCACRASERAASSVEPGSE